MRSRCATASYMRGNSWRRATCLKHWGCEIALSFRWISGPLAGRHSPETHLCRKTVSSTRERSLRHTCRRGIPFSYLSLLLGRRSWVHRTSLIGVNALDYSGYPDCRPVFIQAFERLAALATKAGVEGQPLRVHTPLIDWTKADIIRRGVELGVDYGLTHSCYDPVPDGRPCTRCDSCRLRARGFEEAGLPDPVFT